MSNLLYLGIAVVLSIIGCLILWYRNRKPTSLQAGIEEFQRELRALTPDARPDRRDPGPNGPPSGAPGPSGPLSGARGTGPDSRR